MANEFFESLDLQIHSSQREIEIYTKNNCKYLDNIKLCYLKSLVLLIVSEYEIIIEKIFYLRARECKDTILANFVKTQINNKFRSPDISKITNILKMFDDHLSNVFLQTINNTPAHAKWDNLLRARHHIVHRQGNLNLSYEELISSYEMTKKIILELASILNVDTKKYKSI